MIVKKLSTWEAANLLLDDENADWSRSGALALAEWFEEISESLSTPQEFDRVAMRCDFSEHEDLLAFANEYFGDVDRMRSETGISVNDGTFERDEKIRDFISHHGDLIEFSGGIIVSNF